MALMSATFTSIRWQAQRKPDILHSSINRAAFKQVTRQSLLFGPLLYSTGAASGFISPWLALAIFALIPFYFIFFNTNTVPSTE